MDSKNGHIQDIFKPHICGQHEVTVYQDCVQWGSRIIIPSCLQIDVLLLPYNRHPGMVRMKDSIRSCMRWPKMDCYIDFTENFCEPCQENQKYPFKSPIHPWEWTQKTWS